MEKMSIIFDGDFFDKLVSEGAAQVSDLRVVVKPKGTSGGRPVVAVTFNAMVEGKEVAVQATTTARNFINAARVISAKYEKELADS